MGNTAACIGCSNNTVAQSNELYVYVPIPGISTTDYVTIYRYDENEEKKQRIRKLNKLVKKWR
jgi:hypothetical protein